MPWNSDSDPYASVLGPSNGTDDTATINAQLALGTYVRGAPGVTYLVSTLIFKSGSLLDMRGCTVQQKTGETSYITRNYGWANPAFSASDAAVSSGSNVVTTALGSSATLGQLAIVAGAGNGGNGQLVGLVSAKTSTTITLKTFDGRNCNASATVSAAAITLQTMDSDIGIIGGTWIRTTTPTPLQSIAFVGVDGLSIDIDRFTSTAVCRGVAPMACKNASVTVRDAQTEGVICQPVGPLWRCQFPSIRGVCSDDGLAIVGGDYANHNPVSGDVIDIDVGTVQVVSQALTAETGANCFKLIAGAGNLMDGIRVGSVLGSAVLNGVWLGDDSGSAGTTGGAHGTIDIGLVDVIYGASSYPVNIISPVADSIAVKVAARSATRPVVAFTGGSAGAISSVRISGTCQGTTTHGVQMNAASTSITNLIIENFYFVTSSAIALYNHHTGTVSNLILDKVFAQWSGNTGQGVLVDAGTLSRVVVGAGRYRLCDKLYQGFSGQSACTIEVLGAYLQSINGLALTSAALNVILGPCIVDSLAQQLVYTLTGGSANIFGYAPVVLAGSFTLYNRAGSQAIRVNGHTLPCDVSTLTPTDGDVANNTNGALGCGTGPAVYNTSAAKWKGLYSGVTN